MINLKTLEELRTKEEVLKYFKQLGKEIAEEEIEALKLSYEQAEESSDALTMQQLDDVAGGHRSLSVIIDGKPEWNFVRTGVQLRLGRSYRRGRTPHGLDMEAMGWFVEENVHDDCLSSIENSILCASFDYVNVVKVSRSENGSGSIEICEFPLSGGETRKSTLDFLTDSKDRDFLFITGCISECDSSAVIRERVSLGGRLFVFLQDGLINSETIQKCKSLAKDRQYEENPPRLEEFFETFGK